MKPYRSYSTNYGTPLSVRIPLDSVEHERRGEVLSWMERRHAVSNQPRKRHELGTTFPSSKMTTCTRHRRTETRMTKRADRELPCARALPRDRRVQQFPDCQTQTAALEFLAAFSSQWNRRSPSPVGADLFGIVNKRYLQPSGSHVLLCHSTARV